jgi:Asp-tRNA(Asn)/Glu-tRNA(Gln) amidotransferase A subunit family amidase
VAAWRFNPVMFELPKGRISGRALKTLVAAGKTPARYVLTRVLRADLGIDRARALAEDTRLDLPMDYLPVRARKDHARPDAELGVPAAPDWPVSARALGAALREREISPEQAAECAIAGAKRLAAEGNGHAFVYFDEERALAAARESAARLERRDARGPLEGVPVAIKEEVDVAGLPTRVGTRWMAETPAAADATAVRRLRAAGAVVIGTTAMTEYGMSPLGGNAMRDMPRNAHDPSRLPGGSSSGSGVAVATGIVPVALGADAGGSIRIPAALNGVFGLKPTFGRLPTTGEGLRGGSSVVHLGPLAVSSYDLAVFVEAAHGADELDRASLAAPRLAPGELVRALGRGVRGLKIGVEENEWSAASAEVAAVAHAGLDALERAGANLVPVKLPLARYAPAIGYLTIGIEFFSAMLEVRRLHLDELGLDVQMLLSGLETFRADDYLDAQRLRAALRREVANALSTVDVLALPTTARTAPPVTDEEARTGFVDPPALDAMCRFAFLANLTGLPAGTAPVGADGAGLPVGLQIVGDAWDEAAVLQTLAELERAGAARVTKPPSYVDLLAS